MNLSLRTSLVALSCLSILAGCEIKTEVDPENNLNDRFAGKPRVEGPKLEGSWQTPCLTDGSFTATRQTFTFSGQTFERKTDKYSDLYCQSHKETEKFSGAFIFTHKYQDGSYNIYYAIDAGEGWTQYVEEKLLLEKNILYTSQFVAGEEAPLHRNRPLKLNGWTSSTCENYAGKYESQGTILEIQQKGCESITIDSGIYLPDGIERNYRTGKMKTLFFENLFRKEYKNLYQESIMEQWSFQTRPCNTLNTSQKPLLTKETWINGAYSYIDCKYFNRTENL